MSEKEFEIEDLIKSHDLYVDAQRDVERARAVFYREVERGLLAELSLASLARAIGISSPSLHRGLERARAGKR